MTPDPIFASAALPPFAPAPVVLAGRHVRLEPLNASHASAIFAAGRHPETWQWMLTPVFANEQAAVAWIAEAGAAGEAGTRVPFAIVRIADGTVVGSTSLFDFKKPERALEIGHSWLTPSAQRTPVNTACKRLLLAHAFEVLGAIRVQLKTDARNERSQRAIERLGAVREGVLRRFQRRHDGYQRDTVFYSILTEEWPAVKARLDALLD